MCGTKKKKKRSKRKTPVRYTPGMNRMMELAMKGTLAITGVGVMRGIAGSVLDRIP